MKFCKVLQVFPLNRERNLGAYPGQFVELSDERCAELCKTGHVMRVVEEIKDLKSVLFETDFVTLPEYQEEKSNDLTSEKKGQRKIKK